MQAILSGIARFTPPTPQPLSREYDGVQYKWMNFVFRPAAFKFEGYMLAALGTYVLLHLLGKSFNMGRAKKAYGAITPLVESQFSVVKPLVSSTSALHVLYATGRRNVLAFHGTLALLPYHDVISLVVTLVMSIMDPTADNEEHFTLDATLGRGEHGLQGEGLGVWAVLSKNSLKDVKAKRFDLSFPRLHESASVPITHALFAEHSDVTDVLFKTPNIGILELLKNPQAADVLKSFIITDQPADRPARGPLPNAVRIRKVQVITRKPSSADQEAAVNAWLQVALNVSDLLGSKYGNGQSLLKPDVQRKLAKTRTEVDASLARAYAKEREEDLGAPETAEEKRAAKKRAERAAMSDKEIKKAEELERKRELRKMQKRGMKA